MYRITKSVHIDSGSAVSDDIEDLRGYRVAGVKMPSAFDGNSITFQGAVGPNDTYQDIYDSDGNELSLSVATGNYVHLGEQDVEELQGLWGIRLRAGGTGTPQSQSADRDFTIVLVGW